LLGAGASILRQSGWRDTPITLGEQLGYAIPAGMQAYYNQTVFDQQEEDRLAEAETEREEAETDEEDRAAFIKYLKASGLSEDWVQLYSGMYNTDPKGTWAKLQAHVQGDETAEGKAETKAEQKERFIKGLKAAGVKPARYDNFLGMFDVKPETAFTKLDALLSEKNKPEDKKDKFRVIPKDKIAASEYAHLDSIVPEGGFLQLDKDGQPTPMDSKYRPVNVDEKAITLTDENKPIPIGFKNEIVNGKDITYKIWESRTRKYQSGHPKEGEWIQWTEADSQKDVVFTPPIGNYGWNEDTPSEIQQYVKSKGLIPPKGATQLTIDDNEFVSWTTPEGERKSFYSKTDLLATFPKLEPALVGQPNNAVFRLEEDARGGLTPIRVKIGEGPKTVRETLLNPVTGFNEEVEFKVDPETNLIDLDSKRIIGVSGYDKSGDRLVREFEPGKDGKTGTFRNIIYRTLPGGAIQKIPLGVASVKHSINDAGLQSSIEKQRKEDLLTKDFPALLAELKKYYGVSDDEIKRLKNEGKRDIDSAWKEATAHFTAEKPYEFYGDIRRGSELNEIVGLTGDDGFVKRAFYNLDTEQDAFDENILYRLTKDGEWVDLNDDKNRQQFTEETALRKEYNLITRDVRIAGQAYMGLLTGSAHESGMGDIMIITSFRRMFEPDSVVREGEFAITEEAQGAWNKFIQMPEKFMEGNRLRPASRQLFVDLAINYMAGLNTYFGKQRDRYRQLGKIYNMKNVNTLIHDPLHGLPLTENQRMEFKLSPEGYMKELKGTSTFSGVRVTTATEEEIAEQLAQMLAEERARLNLAPTSIVKPGD